MRDMLFVVLALTCAACSNRPSISLDTQSHERIEALTTSITHLTKTLSYRDKQAPSAETNEEKPILERSNRRDELINAAATEDSARTKEILIQMSNGTKGVDQIADAFYQSVLSSKPDYWLNTFKAVMAPETQGHILALTLFSSIAARDQNRIDVLYSIVNKLDEEQKKQMIGYLLFVNSSQTIFNLRNDILDLAEKLGLNKNHFDKTSDQIKDLKTALDAVVIGQENAKVALSVAIGNHYQRLKKGLKKSNILIIGPSGTGKTFMVQTIAESLNVPFAVADASNITQAGYIGGKVKDAVAALLQKADYNPAKMEKGIIFFDEIDKMAARSGRADSEEFKRQAQATLLKIIEGIEIEVPVGDAKVTVDTSKVLFVCAGAFTGLPEIITSRLKRDHKDIDPDIFAQVATEDLIAYGITPELLGRLPNLLTLHELNVNDLAQILKNPRASILEEYKTLFKLQDIELQFTDEAIFAFAEKAVEFKIGARALRRVVEHVMANLQFRLGQIGSVKTCTVTERVVRFNDMPILAYR